MNEMIPMEPAYRAQLRQQYLVPLQRNIVMIVVLTVALLCIPLFVLFGTKAEINYYGFLFLIPVVLIPFPLYRKMANHKRYYFEDAAYGFIVKEQVTIIKVFETPAGINIYWLDHDTIKTFTPDPYRHFHTGEVLCIYYLKHAAEYLAYDLTDIAPAGPSVYKEIGN
ncbi:MAG: hypothetical protein EOP49_41310 [Sphingobacteriales bacterium]|nr:MAG: hypothetical protein EOP49_41310 [Sphingobacteriales bacterium]